VSQIADKYVKKRFFSLENVTTKFSAVQKKFFFLDREELRVIRKIDKFFENPIFQIVAILTYRSLRQ